MSDIAAAFECTIHHLRLRENGTLVGDQSVTMTMLGRAAALLSCSPSALLVNAQHQAPSSAITAKLGAALHESPTPLRPTALAGVLGVSLEQLNTAAEALDEQLEPAGIRLHRENGWRLVSAKSTNRRRA